MKELSAVCNIDKERIFSQDRKGATLLHHAAAANQPKVIEYLLSSPGGLDCELILVYIWTVTRINCTTIKYHPPFPFHPLVYRVLDVSDN